MCMEDIRLGRSLGGFRESFAVADGVERTVCGQSLNRTRLILSSSNAVACVVGPRGTLVASGQGLRLTPTNPTLILRVEEFGELLYTSWVAAGVGGAVTLEVQELVLEKQ